MIELFQWFKSGPWTGKPWLILGKGPTFSMHSGFPDLDKDFNILGLNHVCRERRTMVTHVIDANVLGEVPDMLERTELLIMPRHPHVNFLATGKLLEAFMEESAVLRSFEAQGRLLWYNLSTWEKPHEGSPVVKVGYFSAEAAVRLLAIAGVKVIRTLGIDGGNRYAGEFKDIAPFRGGHVTFDHQNQPIMNTVREFGVDYAPLATRSS
jgi:hypothetical protein